MNGEEFDRDFNSRMQLLDIAGIRNENRAYGTKGDNDDDSQNANYKRRKTMRGRKGKYYSQVDAEDQNFLE